MKPIATTRESPSATTTEDHVLWSPRIATAEPALLESALQQKISRDATKIPRPQLKPNAAK